jgi:membrane-associated phospholipid phosphatase
VPLHRLLALGLACVVALPSSAKAQGTPTNRETAKDTTTLPRIPLFTWRDGVLAGGFVIGTIALFPVDKRVAEDLQTPGNQANHFFKTVATGFTTIASPGSYIIGAALYVGGKATGQKDVADLGLHGTEAIIVGSAVAYVLKGTFGRERPFVHPANDSTGFDPYNWKLFRGFSESDARSFPSGHTIAAFAAAAAVSNESSRWWPKYRWYVGTVMYGGATMVGLSRMFDNKHWASDVMMGAAIGTFAGNKVVRYNHRTDPNNRLDKWLLAANLIPTPDGGYAIGLSFTPSSW